MNDNNKTPAPGASLFAGVNERLAGQASGEAVKAPAPVPPEAPAASAGAEDLSAPIPFSTEGLPGNLSVVATPERPNDVPERVAPETPDIEAFTLGESEAIQQLAGLETLRQAALGILAQAQREVLITSIDLEMPRYDNDAFIDQLSLFARSSRHTVTRILIGTPQLAVRESHRLVGLARRLSSLIEVRQIHENDLDELESWIIADSVGVLRCTSRQPWLGVLNPKAIPHGQHYREQFYEWWMRAGEVPDFREIRI